MTQNQLKMLFCVFQIAFITCGLYFYIFWKRIDNKPYYEQLAFTYALILGFTELLVAIILFILMKTRVQITNLGQIVRYIRQNCYKEYYALIIINLAFLISFNIITIVDSNSVNFENVQSLHFIAAYYIQSVLFAVFSNDLLQRRALIPNEIMFEREGIFRCAYEVVYYVICLFIILSYFLVTHFEDLPEPSQTLCELIIFTLLYLFYSVTKIGILIKIFLIITTCRLLFSAGKSLSSIQDDGQKGIQITLIVIASVFISRMVQQCVLGFLKARQEYINQIENQPPDILSALNLLPPRDPYIRPSAQVISEEMISGLPVHKFKLENEFVCSICDMNLQKDELIMKLPCSHLFHPDCLKPWLRLKNSCPNCRQQIIPINNPPIQNQIILFQELQQIVQQNDIQQDQVQNLQQNQQHDQPIYQNRQEEIQE